MGSHDIIFYMTTAFLDRNNSGIFMRFLLVCMIVSTNTHLCQGLDSESNMHSLATAHYARVTMPLVRKTSQYLTYEQFDSHSF